MLLATSWLTWTPDCFTPTQLIRLLAGTRSSRMRLVTPLGKDCAMPESPAAITSTR